MRVRIRANSSDSFSSYEELQDMLNAELKKLEREEATVVDIKYIDIESGYVSAMIMYESAKPRKPGRRGPPIRSK